MLGGESRQQGIPYGINITNAPGLSVPPQKSQWASRVQAATPSRQQTIPMRQMLQTGRPRTPQGIERERGIGRGRGAYMDLMEFDPRKKARLLAEREAATAEWFRKGMPEATHMLAPPVTSNY